MKHLTLKYTARIFFSRDLNVIHNTTFTCIFSVRIQEFIKMKTTSPTKKPHVIHVLLFKLIYISGVLQ